MALVLADRVKETTTSTGTTAITLAGAATGYQTFSSAVGNANTTYYTIADQTGANWEVGVGTYTTSGNTLSRDTVLSSSNAGSLVDFTTGVKDVFVSYPAERALYSGGDIGTPASGTLTNCTGYTYANLSGTVPTWNQNTTGTAANLTSATTLPSGMTLVAPVLGTPASGNLSNCTFPTLNQNTTGTAANVTGIVAVANGGTGTTTPSLVAGSNVTITGTWPNQTIAASGGGGGATKTISNKTAAYTVVAGDLDTIINCTANTFTVSLTAAATLGTGFTCTIWNTGTGAITIDPNASETIDGVATCILRQGEGTDIVCDGTNWQTSYKKTMRGYAENMQSTITRPVASGTNAIALGNNASSTGNNSIALGFTSSAVGSFGIAIGYNTSAGIGDYSTSISSNSAGGGSVTATGAGAMALGGSYASGADSFAAAIGNNTSSYGAQGPNSVAIGQFAKVTSSAVNSIAISSGNTGATVSLANSIAIGNGVNVSKANSIGVGQGTISGAYSLGIGFSTTITADFGVAIGGYANTGGVKGKISFGSPSGYLSAALSGSLTITATTTTTTAVVLTSDKAAASTNNQIILASDQARAISGTLIAKQSGSGNMAGWTITGIVSNNAGTMAVSGLALIAIGTDSIGLGAAPTIAVDNTNKGVTITSGYKAATNIRWVANVQTSEVTYA